MAAPNQYQLLEAHFYPSFRLPHIGPSPSFFFVTLSAAECA